ncbi:solute carrier organic anion transporter family member 2B1 [Polypterus senegalus]|uniref:solute carrier organic anion transporter family member 2B1 n=1 Tax=Polypterus senegalus TaxID=55291 RepID=UPI001962A930|nr:solute carrier organic anion transporter family member 2B1 [Polypterus senegalus]XP_039601649.1 solute carrier organic anion transporter family member 2B1 [Polypterus senegalus]
MTATNSQAGMSSEQGNTRRFRRSPFSSIKFFVFCHGLLQLAQLLVSSYLKSSISTIEKRYGLSSQTSGLLASFNEVGNTILIVFVSFFGSRVHRPRFIGGGALIASIAGFLMALPHLVTGHYEYDRSFTNVPQNQSDPKNGMENERQTVLAIMFIGQLLLGIGGVPIQPFGISYIDDYASERNSPLYIGILFSITVLGPALAFMLGSVMLRFYVDIDKFKKDKIFLNPGDPRWVGAWWLGFIVAASLVLITCIPYFFFPREMPKEADVQYSNKRSKNKMKEESLKNQTLLEFIKSFPVVLLKTLRNPIYLLVVLAQVNLSAMVAGLATFMAKFHERQFNVTASFANLLIGGVNIPAVVLGVVIGGVIMKRLQMSIKDSAFMCTVAIFLCIGLAIPLLFLGCATQKVAGVNFQYSSNLTNETADCYRNLSCNENEFNPICGADGIEYKSPCLAGCSKPNDVNHNIINYTDCKCISKNDQEGLASPGTCGSSCTHLLLPFMVFSALTGFVASFAQTPSFMMVLRSVSPDDKSLALGIQFMLFRILAWMPGPVLYGTAIDSTCLSWGIKNNKTAACLYYDNNLFRHRFLGLQIMFECFAFLCFLMTFIILRKSKNEPVEQKRIEETEKDKMLQPEMCKLKHEPVHSIDAKA